MSIRSPLRLSSPNPIEPTETDRLLRRPPNFRKHGLSDRLTTPNELVTTAGGTATTKIPTKGVAHNGTETNGKETDPNKKSSKSSKSNAPLPPEIIFDKKAAMEYKRGPLLGEV